MQKANTVIIGNGNTTAQAARELQQNGERVVIATSQPVVSFENNAAELLTGVTLDKLLVTPQGYDLKFVKDLENISRQADRIVLCDDYQRQPEFNRYGLKACDQVVSLSEVVTDSEKLSSKKGSVVFLTGIYKESHPLILQETLESSIRLATELKQKVYILTGNLQVGARGLEVLYREARRAGVIVVKFTREKPSIEQVENGRAAITFNDEITGHCFRLTPDLTVVDETLNASEDTVKTARMLAVHQDNDGFAQMDNVHRLPVLTNRRCILAAGPSRAVLDRDQLFMDVGNIGLACNAPEDLQTPTTDAFAEIDPGRCVRCLTCLRLCPFAAVVVDARVQVAANLCEGCGICAAECPKGAIDMRQPADASPVEQFNTTAKGEIMDDFQPEMIAFCCSRSAVQAASLAGCLGYKLPPGLNIIQVPCAGALSTGDLLNAFQNNADGVLVLTCHTGNCHAEEGNQHAGRRVKEARKALDRVGLIQERLLKSTLAANMSAEFIDTITCFADTLKKMGPLGI